MSTPRPDARPEVLLIDCYPDGWKDRVHHFVRTINRSGMVSITVDYRAARRDLPLPRFGGAVVTGSPAMLSERAPRAGLGELVESLSCPVLGVCFGHQLLGHMTGVPVHRGEKHERIERVRLRKPHFLFAGLGDGFEMLESHEEFLDRAEAEGAGWEVLAESDSCPVEAMARRDRPWYGVQFHPERSKEAGDVLVENFVRSLAAAGNG